MKQLSGILAAAAFLSVLVTPLNQGLRAEKTEPRTITVTGDAEVRVVPDEVILTLGVETWDKQLDVAKNQNDFRVRKVINAVQAFDIESKHIQTDHISIEPVYDGYHYQNKLVGYYARKSIVITLRDITKFEDLLANAIDAGANYVHGIQFRTTEMRKHRDQARALAVNAAREKAADMAGELDQKLGLPQTIREDHIGWWSWYSSGWWGSRWGGAVAQNVIQEVNGNPAMSDEGLAPGQISVTARITVTFELQ
ncbi:MAG: DUF541 domain-containing protein [Anaerolineales bacterium]|nr:DUF541 domain-containing protein [Anaerolineales bacterium]